MSEGTIVGVTFVIGIGIAVVLIITMVQASIGSVAPPGLTRIWSNFGLSISFLALFLVSWIAQAVAEWGTYVQEEHAHGETPSSRTSSSSSVSRRSRTGSRSSCSCSRSSCSPRS